MAVQQSDIDALNSALASGEKIVRIGEKLVEYRSPEAIIIARDDLRAQMALESVSAGGTPRPRVVYHTQGGRGY